MSCESAVAIYSLFLSCFLFVSATNPAVNVSRDAQQETHDLVRTINETLKELSRVGPSAGAVSVLQVKQQRIQQDRLATQFGDLLKQFQRLQRQAAEKEKLSVARTRSSIASSSHESSMQMGVDSDGHLVPMQSQEQLEEVRELQELRQREEAMKQLEADIVDVNHIFNELALLVHDQGETIDSIDANVEAVLTNVETAAQELHKADTYAKKARYKKFIIILILVLALIAVILVIYFSVKK